MAILYELADGRRLWIVTSRDALELCDDGLPILTIYEIRAILRIKSDRILDDVLAVKAQFGGRVRNAQNLR